MMSAYAVSQKEFVAICALNGPDRYQYFIRRVADWQNIWSLRNESGWVAAADYQGNSGFPVWPHPEYAAACAVDEWKDNVPTAIKVHEFIEDWLPHMAEEHVAVIVFSTPTLRGVMISATELQGDLRQELSQYE